MDMGLNLTGDLTAGLDKLVADVESQVLISGAAATARVFYDEAKAQASKHIKSGTLYDAIYRAFSPEESTPQKVVYHVSWNSSKAPHGGLIEWGTSHSQAFPFIRPAYDMAQAAVDAGIARMAERMEEVRGK